MPKGIFSNPEERIKKISQAHKKGSYFNCVICGNEFWRKPFEIKEGNNKFCSKKCYFIWQKGRKRSELFKEKCHQARLKKASFYTIDKINRFWRGTIKYKQWREAVFARDNWTCQECGSRSKKGLYLRIEAHHKKPFSTFPELRFIVDNGITLCKKCHDKKPKGKEILCIK
jgi:predicted nucleic acid-binding Zn ribbon protein